MKKIVGFLLVVATLFSIVGCSKTEAKKAEKQVLDVIISQYGNYTQEWWTEFEAAFEEAKTVKGMPVAIIMKTVKGKGVSFMENNAGWHGKAPKEDEYKTAMEDLNKLV